MIICVAAKLLIGYDGEIVTLWWRNLADTPLLKIQINVASVRRLGVTCLRYNTLKGHSVTLAVVLPKLHSLRLFSRNNRQAQSVGHSSK